MHRWFLRPCSRFLVSNKSLTRCCLSSVKVLYVIHLSLAYGTQNYKEHKAFYVAAHVKILPLNNYVKRSKWIYNHEFTVFNKNCMMRMLWTWISKRCRKNERKNFTSYLVFCLNLFTFHFVPSTTGHERQTEEEEKGEWLFSHMTIWISNNQPPKLFFSEKTNLKLTSEDITLISMENTGATN